MKKARALANDTGQRSFNLEVHGTARDLGELQYNVLLCVSEKHYPEGKKLLNDYLNHRGSSRPYRRRTEPIFRHSEELINAIEAKKSFPNLTALPPQKQEELHSKVLEHWEDLKICLRRLKSIEREMAMEDARSSVWVIKAVLFSFMVCMGVFLMSEGFRSFGGSFYGFMSDTFKLLNDALNSF